MRAVPVVVLGAIVLAATACGSGSSHGGGGVVTSGLIGPLRIDVSTRAAIVAYAGNPDASVTGSYKPWPTAPPTFRALGYDCSHDKSAGIDPGANRPADVYCRTVYYMSPQTQRLAAFWTDSSDFRTSKGFGPGWRRPPQTAASTRRRRVRGTRSGSSRGTPTFSSCRHVTG